MNFASLIVTIMNPSRHRPYPFGLPVFARLIQASETLPLRQAILREGLPKEQSIFAGDDEPTTFHVGTFEEAGSQPLAIATMMLQDDPRCHSTEEDGPVSTGSCYRLRGMAVAKSHQRSGLGTVALVFAEKEAIKRGAKIVWCNAREPAVPFYLRNGYESVGELFTIPTVGPHFFCRKRLE